jgi:hypothetical protein
MLRLLTAATIPHMTGLLDWVRMIGPAVGNLVAISMPPRNIKPSESQLG